jgi:hypothetical protein
MAEHIGQPTRSRRFIKVYLITWGLLAVGAVAYLTLLAFPQPASTPVAAAAKLEPAKDAPAEGKALAEVRSVRGSLSEIRKDVTQLQEAVGERVVNEKVVQSRLTALEERVATIDPDQPQPPPASAPGAKAPDKTARKPFEPHTTADILAKTKDEPAAATKADAPAQPPFVPLETGSIASAAPKAAPAAEIVFGEAVVTPAPRPDFAVQLAAGPSLQALRQSWDRLVERHGGSLGSLKPRVVAPRSEGGAYRLLAGPVPSKADADKVCATLAVGPKGCFATEYAGQPL